MTGAVVATVFTAALAPFLLRAMTAAGWTRPNWRGTEVPFPAGAIAALAGALGGLAGAIAALAGALGALAGALGALAGALGGLAAADPAVVAIGLATALTGLLDDLVDAPPRGLRGHAVAALRGQPSTGLIKAATTATVAALVLDDLVAAAVVALAAHVFNLLDLRPGRAVKAFVVLVAASGAATAFEPLREIAVFAGPLLVLGAYDLRERAMLGDTGSTLLGAMAGLYLVAVVNDVAALVILIAISLYGELHSLSRLIEKVPPLRVLDWLGRKDRYA